MTGFAVLLTDPGAAPAAAAAFLAARPGSGAPQAAAFLRANPGCLGRALTRAAAEELLAEAAAAGLRCSLFSEDDLKAPPPPAIAQRAELLDGGLRAASSGALLFIRYEDVLALAAAAWDAPAPAPSVAALAPGILAKVVSIFTGGPPQPERGPRETFFRADLLAADGTRLLFEPESLDFSPLGQARTHSSLENFRLLLDALRLRIPGAAVNACLPALLARSPLAPLKVAGPEAADADLTRLLLLARRS